MFDRFSVSLLHFKISLRKGIRKRWKKFRVDLVDSFEDISASSGIIHRQAEYGFGFCHFVSLDSVQDVVIIFSISFQVLYLFSIASITSKLQTTEVYKPMTLEQKQF